MWHGVWIVRRTLPRMVHRITVCSEDLHGLFQNRRSYPISFAWMNFSTNEDSEPRRVAFASA